MTNLSGNNVDNIEPLIEQFSDDDHGVNDERRNFLPISVDTSPPAQNMAVEDNLRHKKKVPVDRPAWQESVYLHMTTAAHACLLLYVILITYFCFSSEFEFFTWHPLLMSTGWMFLMTEAILVMSKDNILTGTLPKKVRVRLHWIFLAIAVTLILIGFGVVFINKNNLNKEHFKTWHAFLGFIGILCSIPTCINGVLALYHGDLRNYIRPPIIKFVHITCGVIAFSFGGLALILSVYTKWFARHSDNNILTFFVALSLVLVSVLWTAYRPAVSSINRLKGLLWEKRKN